MLTNSVLFELTVLKPLAGSCVNRSVYGLHETLYVFDTHNDGNKRYTFRVHLKHATGLTPSRVCNTCAGVTLRWLVWL